MAVPVYSYCGNAMRLMLDGEAFGGEFMLGSGLNRQLGKSLNVKFGEVSAAISAAKRIISRRD